MSYLGKPIQCRVEEFLQQYSQLPYICRCNDKIHAYHLGISGIVCEELHAIWLETYVLPPVVCLTQHSDCNCVDKHLKAVIKMDKQTKHHIVEGASSIFVANALIGDFNGLPLLDVHHAQGIVIRDFQSRERHDSITTAEMCAGGFAGWLHASSVCCIRGPKLKPLFAVEWEQEISDTYCKNWKDAQQIHSLESYHRDMQPDRYPLFVEDIQMGWWLQCVGKSFLDIMFLSAPCQPWSSASIGKGLLSEDGWSSLVALVIAAYLRPKAVGWEQVAGIQKHRHWPILKSVAKRCGFDVVLESKCNLAEISPQNRERLLVLLLDSNLERGAIDLTMFAFPSFNLKSLIGFNAIMEDVSDFGEHTFIDGATLDMYLDEKLLPRNQEGKRRKIDMMSYRLRQRCDGFGCIMASYTSQHEIDIHQLREKGLYGTLLHDQGRIRFLSGPECAVLMMPCVETFIPCGRKLHMKILGNAIATAHASFLLGGIMQILDMCEGHIISPSQMVIDTLKVRLHFGNAEVINVGDGWAIRRKTNIPMTIDYDWEAVPISPTLGQFRLVKTVITCGEWKISGWVDQKFDAALVLESFGIRDEDLLSNYLRTVDKVTIILERPFLTPLTSINWNNQFSPGVMVLHRGGFVLLGRNDELDNAEVLHLIEANTHVKTKHMCLCNVIGKKLDDNEVPLPVTMLVSVCIDSDKRWHSSLPEFCEKSGCITASMPMQDYREFVSIIKAAGVDQFCAIWGWNVRMSNTLSSIPHGYVHFQRTIESFVLTTETFFDMLAMWIMRIVLPQNISPKVGNTLEVSIKFYGSMIWRGWVEDSWTLDMLCNTWNMTMKAFNKECEIRNVVLGKMRHYDELLLSFQHETQSHVRVSWVLPMQGGGAKDENRFLAKNKLASLLLLHGVPFSQVADYTDKVVKSISPGKLLHEMSNGDSVKGWIVIKEWLNKMGHPVPDADSNIELAAQKIQRAIRKRKDLPLQKIKASQVSILPDHFLRHDKTPAIVLKNIIDAKTGIILLDPEDASPWINGDKISQDSLACIVIGHSCPCEKKGTCNKVSVPILDSKSQPALVAGCLHQLGSKPILLPQDNMVNIAMDQSQIMCFTIYKDERESDFWNCVMQNPVKSIVQVLKEHCDQTFMACSPWGRSWKNGKGPSDIERATSFQFHTRVKQDFVELIMQISGRGPVYCTPKSEDKGLLQGWAVIWLKISKRDILIEISKMSIKHAGLVRTFKGMGVRVIQKDFDAAFKHLRPHDKAPPSIAAKYLYKIQPLPSGMTAENVQEFTKSKGWETRPMRALGRASWLLASESPTPATWLGLNGRLVLVKQIQQSQQRDPPVILAGKIASDNKAKSEMSRASDPWLQQSEDPWIKYQPLQSSVASTVSSVSTPQHSLSDPSLAKKLQEQDDKISSLQNSLQDLKKVQQKQDVENKHFQSELDGKLRTMKAEVSDQVTNLSSQFQSSLQSALSKQDSQIQSGFDELKSLFMQSRGCSEASRLKKHKGPGNGSEPHHYAMNSDDEMAASPGKDL